MDKINVAVQLNGGIGTYLMQINFLKYFYEKFPGLLNITVYGDASETVNDGLLWGQDFIADYDVRRNFRRDMAELVLVMNWFPDVVHIDEERIKGASEELLELINVWRNFKQSNATRDFVRNDSIFDPNIYNYTIANGKNRLDVMDIGGCLGITKDFYYQMVTTKEEQSVLNRLGLEDCRYITMQQGVNANSLSKHSPKQWSNQNYSDLCSILKGAYPDIVLVQLGEAGNNEPIEHVDKCLLGETDFEDLKIILKNAWLHIDGECGMVHMRKALHAGPSVVLFGQTPIGVYSYEGDINITANICNQGCSKLFPAWKRKCYLDEVPRCMAAITPEMVFEAIKDYAENGLEKKEEKKTKIEELLADDSIFLDEEWRDGWLATRELYAYWLEKVTIGKLFGMKLTEDGYVKVPLAEMPAYQYMHGNEAAYQEYMELNDKYNPGHEHSMERIKALEENLEKTGYDTRKYIVVDGENKILDGVHRACWLLHKYGENQEITVLKIYGDWNI